MDNPELGRLVLKQAAAFPETFNMGSFYYEGQCGTTACLAGWALLLDGYELRSAACSPMPGFYRADGTFVWDIELEALNLLGLAAEEYFDDERIMKKPLFFEGDPGKAIARFARAVDSGLPGVRWVDRKELYHCIPAGEE
jgi:hypothetical protein